MSLIHIKFNTLQVEGLIYYVVFLFKTTASSFDESQWKCVELLRVTLSPTIVHIVSNNSLVLNKLNKRFEWPLSLLMYYL